MACTGSGCFAPSPREAWNGCRPSRRRPRPSYEPPSPQTLSKSDEKKLATSRRYGHPILHGQTLYLGGEEGPDGRIYCVPGHASRVLCIDTKTDDVYPIGPISDGDNCVLKGKFKWLRGITIGDVIYGLPCHADTVLRIDTRTGEVGTLAIPYEDYFDADECPEEEEAEEEGKDDSNNNGGGSGTAANEKKEAATAASRERNTPWKYHGGCVSPHDGAIYAIPQTVSSLLLATLGSDPPKARRTKLRASLEGLTRSFDLCNLIV